MKVLVSACLMGRNCKYNGGNNYSEKLAEFLKGKEVMEICPEVLGGLPTPRPSVELVNGIAMDKNGDSKDEAFHRGVDTAMEMIKEEKIDLVVLQSRSPSCGVKQIYDGSFSGKLIEGRGLFAQALKDAGYPIVDVEDI